MHDDGFIHTLLSTYTIAPTTDWLVDEGDNRQSTKQAS